MTLSSDIYASILVGDRREDLQSIHTTVFQWLSCRYGIDWLSWIEFIGVQAA